MRIVRFIFTLIAALCSVPLAAQPCVWSTDQTGKIVETCGSVGIGTTSPDRDLQVINGASSGRGIEVATVPGGTRKEVLLSIDGSYGYLDAYNFVTATGYPLKIQVNGGNTLLNPAGGKVGIGQSSPAATFTNYNANVLDASGIGISGVSDFLWSTSGAGYIATIENRDPSANFRNALLVKAAAGDANSYIAKFESAGVNRFTLRADGTVGIGTIAPDRDLQIVNGGSSGRGLEVATASGSTRKEVLLSIDGSYGYLDSYNFVTATGYPLKVQVNGGNTLLNPGAGNVGIGQSSPAAKLTNYNANVLDASGAGITGASDFLWSTSGQGYVAAIENRDTTANLRNALLVKAAATDTNSYIAKFESGGVNRVAVRADGLVSVNGSISATGTIVGAVYQDVAEWVPATTKMDPGTVVVLNPEHNNEVMPSEEAYDTRVAGVVSAQPGVLLGKGGDAKAMIATTGRVRVHVDATKHPVRIGDLLVTSDTAGTAMVSEPMEINGRKFHQPGTVVGKALEPLAGGRGEILVLLSMQ
jgi:hypothetical protein